MSRSQTSSDFAAVIVGGGSGQRFGHPDKILTPLAGCPLLWHSIDRFAVHPDCVEIIVVLGRHTMAAGQAVACGIDRMNVAFALGGDNRRESVLSGLTVTSEDCAYIAIHDAARPLFTATLISNLLTSARRHGAAIPVVQVTDTLHYVSEAHQATGTVDRDKLRAAQTPQIARRKWLIAALQSDKDATDEGGSLIAAGYPVAVVPGEADNIKITLPEDLELAEAILSRRSQ